MAHCNEDRCQEYAVNPEAVAAARQMLPGEQSLAQLAGIYQALSGTNRLKILFSLSVRELCVCELGEVLQMSAPAVSHHLRRLKDLGLVRTRREGKLVYYTLDDEHINELLQAGIAHASHRQGQRR